MIQKKSFLIGLLGITLLSSLFSSAHATSQQDWKEVKSCIDLSNQLKKLIAHPDFNGTIKGFPNTEKKLIEDSQSFSSSTFFTDYNEKKQLLTIIKGPKDAKNTLIDFNKAKKIAKFQLPRDFQELEVLFFRDEMLMLSANRFPKGENPETVVLFYEIRNDKLAPIHFFKQTGKKIKRELINEKLYLITETPFSKNDMQKLIRKDGDLPRLFPKTSEGLSYGVKLSAEKRAKCQDFKYLFSPNADIPQMWSMIVTDLNNLQAAKERFYLLGNFTNLHFSNDFLYASSQLGLDQNLAQRFALEPKINYQKSELLPGKSVQNIIFTEKTKSAFLTERSSGKLKSYILTPFDERFIAQKSVELFSGNESYSSAQLSNKKIVLGNENQLALVGEQFGQRQFKSFMPAHFAKNSQTFFFDFSQSQLLTVRQEAQNIKITLLSKKEEDEKVLLSLEKSSLLGIPAWNRKKSLLFLPLQSESLQGRVFKGIRGFTISEKGVIKATFARNYPQTQQTFKVIKSLPHFNYVINDTLIDLFLTQQGSTMKVLKTE